MRHNIGRKLQETLNSKTPEEKKIFEKEFGISPLKYINNLRLHYALELLKSGYYSVASVSLMAGFNDPNYFSSFIKKMTGYSPSYFFKNRDSK